MTISVSREGLEAVANATNGLGKEECRRELAAAIDADPNSTWGSLLIQVKDDRELLYDQLLKERPE